VVEVADMDPVLAELYDKELIFHGFTPYMRDYEMVVYEPVDPNPEYGLVPRHLRFLFRYCTEATVTSRARPAVCVRSLSDDLLKVRHVSRASTGYVWGVEAQELYPGVTVVKGSKGAARWADQLGIAFHEVLVEANSQAIGLVFSEATAAEILHRCVHGSRRNLRRGLASAVRTQGLSTRNKHPTGHARAWGPSLAQCASEGRCGIRIVDRPYWSLQ
jgi:hypothetical protein